MNWLQVVASLVQLAPSILQLIVQIEQVFGSGSGAVKKSIVMEPVKSCGAPVEVVAGVSNMVDAHVAALNQAGKLLPHSVK